MKAAKLLIFFQSNAQKTKIAYQSPWKAVDHNSSWKAEVLVNSKHFSAFELVSQGHTFFPNSQSEHHSCSWVLRGSWLGATCGSKLLLPLLHMIFSTWFSFSGVLDGNMNRWDMNNVRKVSNYGIANELVYSDTECTCTQNSRIPSCNCGDSTL